MSQRNWYREKQRETKRRYRAKQKEKQKIAYQTDGDNTAHSMGEYREKKR